MSQILWKPDPEIAAKTQIAEFQSVINATFSKHFSSYAELHDWSVKNPAPFWESIWIYMDILFSQPYTQVVDDAKKMPGAKWFSDAKLNFAENLLRYRDDHIALVFYGEDQVRFSLSYGELYDQVARCADALKAQGVNKGDRVAGFMPNRPETIIAMLATASIGAIWSSSSPDFGIKGVLDRFSQIEPKVLFAANGYFYNGKTFDSLEKLNGILDQLPSVEKVVIVAYTEENPDISTVKNGILFTDFLTKGKTPELSFKQLPFDHPLYIMYSSGTTGLPKSIVHGAGGTLLQHLKELRLHTDLRREDTIFYFT
ncbi:MAG: AMP-binding protein, partial [Actinobacteria bacterium]|nr:AMP-binding protein [Actinomycetota bacterium]